MGFETLVKAVLSEMFYGLVLTKYYGPASGDVPVKSLIIIVQYVPYHVKHKWSGIPTFESKLRSSFYSITIKHGN